MKFIKVLKYAITIVLICSFQVSLCNFLAIGNIKPNIVIPFVVATSIINGPVTGGIIGLICGIFIDSLSSGTTIINSLTYMYIAVIGGILNLNYLRKNLGVVTLFTFLGTIICEAGIQLVLFAIWGVSNFFMTLLNPVLLIALYTVVFTRIAYYITLKLFNPSDCEV